MAVQSESLRGADGKARIRPKGERCPLGVPLRASLFGLSIPQRGDEVGSDGLRGVGRQSLLIFREEADVLQMATGFGRCLLHVSR